MEWYERDKERFLLEVKLIKRHYPNAKTGISNNTVVVYKKFLGKFNNYFVKIVYPHNFPYTPPDVNILSPHIEISPHQFPNREKNENGKPCLYDSAEVGHQTTGKVICDWSVRWLKAYEVWLASGRRNFPEKKVEEQWIKLR
ncbi:MAG: hypothetical protein WC614_12365 [bacterium]